MVKKDSKLDDDSSDEEVEVVGESKSIDLYPDKSDRVISPINEEKTSSGMNTKDVSTKVIAPLTKQQSGRLARPASQKNVIKRNSILAVGNIAARKISNMATQFFIVPQDDMNMDDESSSSLNIKKNDLFKTSEIPKRDFSNNNSNKIAPMPEGNSLSRSLKKAKSLSKMNELKEEEPPDSPTSIDSKGSKEFVADRLSSKASTGRRSSDSNLLSKQSKKDSSMAGLISKSARRMSTESVSEDVKKVILSKERGIFREVGNPADEEGTGFLYSLNKIIIHPLSIFRRGWDALLAIAVIYTCWEVPFNLAFTGADSGSPVISQIDNILDVLFWIDICLNFRTGFISHGLIVMDPKKIALDYGGSWFLIDVIAAIPEQLFEEFGVSSDKKKSLIVIKYFKIPKLLRLGRVVKFFAKYLKYSSILQVFCSLIVVTHIGGCCIALTLQGEYPFVDNTISTYTQYSTACRYALSFQLGHQIMDIGKSNVYLNLISFCLVLAGMAVYTILIASVVLLLIQRTSSYSVFRAKVDRVTKEMEYYGLPLNLQDKIQQYYKYLWIHQTRVGSHSMYNDPDLASNLRSEIALFLHKDFIAKVPLFKGCSEECLVAVIFAMKTAIFLPDEFIVKAGETGRHLYVIRLGAVAVIESDGQLVTNLFEGSFFGELALLMDRKRTVSVKSLGFCELSTLSKDHFTRLLVEFPTLLIETRNIADRRRTELVQIRRKKEQILKESFSGIPEVNSNNDSNNKNDTNKADDGSANNSSARILPRIDTTAALLHKFSAHTMKGWKNNPPPDEESKNVGKRSIIGNEVLNSSKMPTDYSITASQLESKIESVEKKIEQVTMEVQSFFKLMLDK